MDCRSAFARPRSILRAAAATAATIVALAVLASGVFAQTLADPNPPAKRPPPQTAAKSRPAAHARSCSGYGAGFVSVPGTDACVKIGGWVTVEGSRR